MKFYDPNWRYAGQNFEVIRYADILLMYAEVTQDPTYLNMVRARVGLPGYGEPGYPVEYNTLALAIEHERRMELCFRVSSVLRSGSYRSSGQRSDATKGYAITQNKLHLPDSPASHRCHPELTKNAGY